MTFSRIKSHGWAINEKLTSPQMTQLDIDHANALDKTGDNVANGGGISGEIDLLSGSSIQAQSGSDVIMNSGSYLVLGTGSELYAENSASVVLSLGSNMTVDGYATIASGGNLIVASGGEEVLRSGSNFIGQSGSTVTLNSGSQTNFNNGSHIDFIDGSSVDANGIISMNGGFDVYGTMEFQSGCTVLIDSGSSVTISGTNTIVSPGTAIQINDSTNPTFASSRTRIIIQPPIPVPSVISNPPLCFAGYFADQGATGGPYTYYVYFTKVILGATLSAVECVCYNNTGSSITSGNATAKVFKMSATTPTYTPTQLGSTQTLGTVTAGGVGILIFSGLTEVIDDSNYVYCVQINSTSGAGAGSLYWYGVQTEFTNITYLGQF